ncbi:helix-turn-helix domain-containing protein [Pseudoalteromonas sp. DL2-H2.2]|uniref:helix-turn-helix domain-containing protein n=1 Tax=Pseudoalteromonas sp. DL2-H2.2 TaxID=2908889 RepID=UPI001F3D79DA|nr:helix-turn-helix transcriptional regulator [Pseudoalteromonas sp. DL2-H2.2]MCF2910776.1 helix-turn-helix domain-containing protein [Pseudoalteromonas sp. DL2-H2.2]
MNADQRKQAIQKKGYTLKQVADALGKSLSTVSNVIHGRHVSSPIAKSLAAIVDQPVEVFFSDCESYLNPTSPSVVRGSAREAKVAELRQLIAAAS